MKTAQNITSQIHLSLMPGMSGGIRWVAPSGGSLTDFFVGKGLYRVMLSTGNFLKAASRFRKRSAVVCLRRYPTTLSILNPVAQNDSETEFHVNPIMAVVTSIFPYFHHSEN